MIKQLLAGMFIALGAGCSHAPIVSSPNEGPNDPYSGRVESLDKRLDGKTHMVVVFMHGVGDHCPGFALNETDGWLKSQAWPTLHLQPASALEPPTIILDSEFLPNHPADRASFVTVNKREY